jgi:hypothetical protein
MQNLSMQFLFQESSEQTANAALPTDDFDPAHNDFWGRKLAAKVPSGMITVSFKLPYGSKWVQ